MPMCNVASMNKNKILKLNNFVKVPMLQKNKITSLSEHMSCQIKNLPIVESGLCLYTYVTLAGQIVKIRK